MKHIYIALILIIVLVFSSCSGNGSRGNNAEYAGRADITDNTKTLTPSQVRKGIIGGYWVGVDMEYNNYLIQFLDDGTAELTPFYTSFVNYTSDNEAPSPEASINFTDYYIPTGEYFIDEQDSSIVLTVNTYDNQKHFRLNYDSDDKCIHYNKYGYYDNYACDVKFIHFDSMPTVQQLYDHLGWSTNYKTYDVDFNKPLIGLQSRLYDDRAFIKFVKDNASTVFNFIGNDSNYHFNTVPVSYYEMAGGKGAEICDSRVSSMEDVQKYFELYVSKNVDISGKMYHYHEENGKLYANYGDKGGLLESLDGIYPYDVKYVSDSVVEITGSCTLSEPDSIKTGDFSITLILENGVWKFDSFAITPYNSSTYTYEPTRQLLRHK